jgi:hypothetical protein
MPTHDLRAQLAYLYDAIGTALALIRQRSYGAAEIILAEALKGKTMTDDNPQPPPPPEPGDNQDIDNTPADIGPSPL